LVFQKTIEVSTRGRGTHDVSAEVQTVVADAGIDQGLCQVFIHHTSASLMLTENADPDVRHDLENYIAKLVLDGDPAYLHDQEGDDDMAAHIRSVLTQSEITIPIQRGRLALGSWQGLFLWEHRYHAHRRNLTVTLTGVPG
jgi:secondary thiamine-phosphate synthase enzyme